MWKLVVSEAVNQAKALNLYTPRLSTPHLQTAQHITQTPAEKLTWVSNRMASSQTFIQRHTERAMFSNCWLISQVEHPPQAPPGWVMAPSLTLWMGCITLPHTLTFTAWTNSKRMIEKVIGTFTDTLCSFSLLDEMIYFKHDFFCFLSSRTHEGTPKSIRRWISIIISKFNINPLNPI